MVVGAHYGSYGFDKVLFLFLSHAGQCIEVKYEP